jgi:hypothetical protein
MRLTSYFANQRALLAAAHPETVAASLLPPDPPADPEARLAAVVAAFTQLILDTENQQRTMLRLSLEAEPGERAALPLRQGRAIGWIEEALSPLGDQLSDQARRHVVLAIRSVVGIEALAWLTDVARLSRADAVALMRWTAQALLRSALTGRPPDAAGAAHDDPVRQEPSPPSTGCPTDAAPRSLAAKRPRQDSNLRPRD